MYDNVHIYVFLGFYVAMMNQVFAWLSRSVVCL